MLGFGMAVASSGPYANNCTSLQTDNNINTLTPNFYWPDALPDAQPTVSEQWRQVVWVVVAFYHFILQSEKKSIMVDVVDSLAESASADGKTASSSSSSSPLMHIEGLLEALTVADKDGRIVVDRQGKSPSLNAPCRLRGVMCPWSDFWFRH